MTTAAMALAVVPLIIAEGAGAAARYSMGLVIFTGLLDRHLLHALRGADVLHLHLAPRRPAGPGPRADRRAGASVTGSASGQRPSASRSRVHRFRARSPR